MPASRWPLAGWLRAQPVLQGVLPIDRSRVPTDMLAGLTLAALGIPEVLGYAKIAGMPLVTGLYTMLLPMAVFAVLGSSRHLVVAADSATAAILAAALTGLAAAGSERYVRLAGLAALLAGGMLLVARLARLGFLANFLSRTVLVGFLTGVGIQVAAGQLPDMLGITAAGKQTLPRLLNTVRALPHAHPADVAISIGVIVIVVAARRITRQIPGPLIAVIIAIIVSWAVGLASHGVAVVGNVPRGLPSLGLPALGWHDAGALLGAALSMFVVILAQSAATSRAYAGKYEEEFSEDTDLVGLGAANVAAAFSGTFVVNGSPTKAQMVDTAGGRSQLSPLTASAVVLLVLVLLTGPLAYLPDAALAAVVFLIAVELIDVKGMRQIRAMQETGVRRGLAHDGRGGGPGGRVRHRARRRRLDRRPLAAQLQPAQQHPGEVTRRALATRPRSRPAPAPRRDWSSTGSAPACTTPTPPSSWTTSPRWPATAARCAGWSSTAPPSATSTTPRPRSWSRSSSTFTSDTCAWCSVPCSTRCGSNLTVTASARPWALMPSTTLPARPSRPSTPQARRSRPRHSRQSHRALGEGPVR